MSLVKRAGQLENPLGQIVRFGMRGALPSVSFTVVVAEALRGAVLSALYAQPGSRMSFLLSGHDQAGRPDLDHRHVYYLPKPDKGGRIYEILVISPQEMLSASEMDALKSVQTLRWGGPSAMADVELLDPNDQSEIKLANQWTSLTPYVPPRRFWGTAGKHHLTPEKQIIGELKSRGFENVIEEIDVNPWCSVRVRLSMKSNTKLPKTPVVRGAFRVCFKSRRSLCGPIALGHSSHFGLGLFAPVV